MNHKLKRRWVAALRSGEYKQCQGVISRHREDGDQYCAYGVLVKIVGMENQSTKCTSVYANIDDAQLSAVVSLNDFQGCSFNEIADWIEEHL
jgi:hypothetical protein